LNLVLVKADRGHCKGLAKCTACQNQESGSDSIHSSISLEVTIQGIGAQERHRVRFLGRPVGAIMIDANRGREPLFRQFENCIGGFRLV